MSYLRLATGGQPKLDYASPFKAITLEADAVDPELHSRYIREAKSMLDKVMDGAEAISPNCRVRSISRMKAFDTFLPLSILEKLRYNINSILRLRCRRLYSIAELKRSSTLHVLAGSYGSCVSIITANKSQPFFSQMGMTGERHKEIWSSLSCTKSYRGGVEWGGNGRVNKPTRGNALLTEHDAEFAAVNMSLVTVEGLTIYLVVDDHNRLSSRAVVQLTNLSQIYNPNKAFGPVNDALCSALTHSFVASDYTRSNEKVIDTWHQLVQLLQGIPTVGALRPMVDSLFVADLGHNEVETIQFLNEKPCACSIGTHKRSLRIPFVFGEGPRRKTHKGMVMAVKGVG